MTDLVQRQDIVFAAWLPVARDHGIAYSYVNPRDGRTVRVGGDRWMRAKCRIAASALASGQTEFRATGGLGSRRWTRIVHCSEQAADLFFRDAIDAGAHMLKGEYRRAKRMQQRRLERERRPLRPSEPMTEGGW